MSNSREISIDNYQETTREKLLDLMDRNKAAHTTYMLRNSNSGQTIIACLEDDCTYIFIQGYPTYFAITPSKIALGVKLANSLGLTSDNDEVGYSVLNENRASLVRKCFGCEEETPNNSIKPRF